MSEPGPVSTLSQDPERRLEQLWRRGQRPEVCEFLRGAGPLPLARLTEVLAVDQRERWRAGERVPAESYLSAYPALADDAELALELVYGEFLLREELGEGPALDEYVRRFPQYAARLAQQAEVHQALADDPALTRMARSDPAHFRPWPTTRPAVAGYEILGELGRGGMGVVYKARQTSLGRVVALKMLRDVHAGPDELLRFRREAESVARLQHPNVVQIYEVGEHDGRPFFALEYVDGGSLDNRLRGDPQPPRQAAELVATLARAVAYAHAQGIVHRDLKPANVLLAARDSSFRETINLVPKITDFGLAKRLEGSGLTTPPGAVMGTPSYMAPEQAAGLTDAIGPACDTYALGALLYELLTGRPPFRSASLADTLQQVRTEEPVSPRRLQPKVPRDLETVCLKCLEKDPDRRYATAGDLADDLQRFLEDRPILARPSGVFVRARKWAHRRPAVAALVAVSALALLLLSGGGWWAALKVSGAADREAGQRRRAEESFRQAMAAVDEMLTEVGAVDLADVPQMEPVRRRLLGNALVFFNDFLRERGDDPSVRFEAARAYGRCGDILALQGQTDDARARFERAVALLDQVPAGAEQRRELGRTQTNLGALLKKAGRFAEAEQAYRRALALRQGLADEFPAEPGYRQDLASTRYLLGALLAPQRGRQKETAECYAAAREGQQRLADEFPTELEYQRDLARTLNNLGMLQWDTGRPEAADSLREAERLQRALADKAPRVPHYRRELARTLLNSASRLETRQDFAAARTAGEEGRDLLRRLVNDYATVPEYRYELAAAQRVLGRLLREQGHVREAKGALRDAIALCEELCKEVPAEPRYGRELGMTDLDLGVLLYESGRLRDAEAAYRLALGVQQDLASRFPDVPAHHADLADTREALGLLLVRRSEEEEVSLLAGALLGGAARDPWAMLPTPARAGRARAALEEGRDLLRGAVAEQQRAIQQLDTPGPRYEASLRTHYFILAEIDLRLGEHAEAAGAAEHLLAGPPADCAGAAEFLARCAGLAADDARLSSDGRQAAGERYADRAVALLRQALNHPGARPAEKKDFLDRMKRQDCYEPLRGRANFKRLLEEAEKSAKVGVG